MRGLKGSSNLLLDSTFRKKFIETENRKFCINNCTIHDG